MQEIDDFNLNWITAAIMHTRAANCLLLASRVCPAVARAVCGDAELLSSLACCGYTMVEFGQELPKVRSWPASHQCGVLKAACRACMPLPAVCSLQHCVW